MSILPSTLLFGTGYTLIHVARILGQRNVVLTTRSKEKASALQKEGFRVFIGEKSPNFLRDIFSQYPSLGTTIDSIPPSQDHKESFESAMEIGKVCADHRSSLVYLSTTGVFGGENGEYVDETTPPRPKHLKAENRWEAEKGYQSVLQEKQLSIVRIPAIYGPQRGLRSLLQTGRIVLIDEGERWTNRIHVEDLSRILCAIAKMPSKKRPSLLAVNDDYPCLQREVISFYCSKFSLPFPPSQTREAAEAIGKMSMLGNQRVLNTFMKKSLSLTLKYPSFKEGCLAEE